MLHDANITLLVTTLVCYTLFVTVCLCFNLHLKPSFASKCPQIFGHWSTKSISTCICGVPLLWILQVLTYHLPPTTNLHLCYILSRCRSCAASPDRPATRPGFYYRHQDVRSFRGPDWCLCFHPRLSMMYGPPPILPAWLVCYGRHCLKMKTTHAPLLIMPMWNTLLFA